MAIVRDFRDFSFSNIRVENCAKFLGKQFYWKLFIIENILRVIINSILWVQYQEKGGEWWNDLAGKAKNNADRNQRRYLKPEAKFHGLPGKHPIYYTDVRDLSEIIRINMPLFIPVLSYEFINKLIVEIENIFIPRNIIAHMNFPTKTDMNRIDILFHDLNVYLNIMVEKKVVLRIP